jgi:poly-gamma-glutamate synthesis protein (capsule biosynthesis protein)
MTGRGIDQILPRPSEPTLHETSLSSATAYVELAERLSGPIPRDAGFRYVWGDALDEMRARAPELRLVNLETSITTSPEPLPKGINYRMHPANVPCLVAAGIDCCTLANNHILDWGRAGLLETISTLAHAGIAMVGAGKTAEDAARPAVFNTQVGSRVLVYACGSTTSGIPASWAATATRPGVHLLPDLSEKTASQFASRILGHKEPNNLVIVSLHWGDNWGYSIPAEQRRFAHRLIDAGAADVVHGHSSHHIKGIEVHRGRLILYGCGDFISDYEGITGNELYRPELVVAYFATLEDRSGELRRLDLVPFRSRQFRLERVKHEDAEWVQRVLTRESKDLGTWAELGPGGAASLHW